MRNARVAILSAAVASIVTAAAFAIGGAGSTKTTTVVEQAPASAATPAAQRTASGPTANEIYRQSAPGVVFIRSQIVQEVQTPFGFGPEQQRSTATGSGFVVDDQGHILTNYHVVAGASAVSVSFQNRQRVTAKVVGSDAGDDLAVLEVSTKDAKLHPLPLGDSRTTRVGDPVLALGNPFGLDRTLTSGIVSALQRELTAPDGLTIDHVIQTDAPINPGNSGGPLLDAAGRVIGINSQIETGGSGNGNVGIGFALPINTAKKVLPEIERNGSIERGYLGLDGITLSPQLVRRLQLRASSGVLVATVRPGSPAAKAGLRGGDPNLGSTAVPLGGDIITKLDGRPIRTIEALRSVVSDKHPGDKVELTFLRAGHEKSVEVTLGKRPSSVGGG